MGKAAATDPRTKDGDTLADAFGELPTAATRCALGRILDEASDLARERIQAALDADHVSINWIVTQLRAAGRRTSDETVVAHRTNRCRCARP
jgi:chorismate-pyruvate lyase